MSLLVDMAGGYGTAPRRSVIQDTLCTIGRRVGRPSGESRRAEVAQRIPRMATPKHNGEIRFSYRNISPRRRSQSPNVTPTGARPIVQLRRPRGRQEALVGEAGWDEARRHRTRVKLPATELTGPTPRETAQPTRTRESSNMVNEPRRSTDIASARRRSGGGSSD
jgi:hypothetical protein